jgi:hypothetical protein
MPTSAAAVQWVIAPASMQPACQFDHMDKHRVRCRAGAPRPRLVLSMWETAAVTKAAATTTTASAKARGPLRKKRAPAIAAARPRAVRRLEPGGDKRSAILHAALGLFSRYGLHGTSVDQVAARADVSKSNLLYYFANKEELYVCVLRDLLAVWLAQGRRTEAARRYAIYRTRTLREFGEEPEFQLSDLRPAARTTS